MTTYDTAVVFMLGYPGMGKRTVGGHLAEHYARIRDLAHRRGSAFLAVMLTCDIDVQVTSTPPSPNPPRTRLACSTP